MKEKVVELIGDKLDDLNLVIDDVIYEKENGNNFLRIVLDSDEVIDLDKIVAATRIINPLMDKQDFIDEKYLLDIYGKSKGD